jgi:hypothetical protein
MAILLLRRCFSLILSEYSLEPPKPFSVAIFYLTPSQPLTLVADL